MSAIIKRGKNLLMETFKRIVSLVLVFVLMLAGTAAVGTQTAAAADKTQGTTKVVTKVTTKTTNKSVKMKKAAKQNKVTTKITTKKSSKVLCDTNEKKITENKTVKTTVKTTYKKKSKIKKIKTTVKTTIKTTTTVYTKEEKLKDEEIIQNGRDKVTPSVLSAFDELGFDIKVNKDLESSGTFSTEKHDIELKTVTCGVLLHEMGHFLECLKHHAAETDEFAEIYTSEKDKYTGSNKKYVTSTKYEYFAESYRDYVETPAELMKERPDTFTYIDSLVKSVSHEDVDYMNATYGMTWQ